MHSESETSEILSAESPWCMSVLLHCTKCMNMVQDEPLLQFFHIVFWFEAVRVDCSFCLGLFGLMTSDCILGMASGHSVGWIWMATLWRTVLSSPAATWGAIGLQDLGKCCFLVLGYGCALGKPGCCYPCSGEARQGLGWFGFRGAGVSDLWSRSCTGLLSITRSNCGQSGVQSFEDLFYQGFHCRGLFLSWGRKCSGGEKGDIGPWQYCCAVLCWWCPETELTDEGCCVILKGKELGQSCAKLGVEGDDSISASSVWMFVLDYWREMRACLRSRALPVHLRSSDHYEFKWEGFACTVEPFHDAGQCNIERPVGSEHASAGIAIWGLPSLFWLVAVGCIRVWVVWFFSLPPAPVHPVTSPC